MFKPVFLYWAHKEMWNNISEMCKKIEEKDRMGCKGKVVNDYYDLKEKAYNMLRKKYSILHNINIAIEAGHQDDAITLQGNVPAESVVGERKIRKVYKDCSARPVYLCFACNAFILATRIAGHPFDMGYQDISCLEKCPLEWPDKGSKYYNCAEAYREWSDATDILLYSGISSLINNNNQVVKSPFLPSELAAKIANLPLKERAREYYAIAM